MLDVLIALALLGLGFVLGRTCSPEKPEAPRVEEQEQIQLREDRAAFAQLMGYNAGQAYGLHDQ